MPDRDALGDRGRSLEDEYFWKKDRELIERLEREAADARVREGLERASGLREPEAIQELRDLGFTPETATLLPIVPILQVAWAEGGIRAAERDLLVAFARSRGIKEGSAADRQLTAWMTTRPPEAVFTGAGRLIRAMLESGTAQGSNLTAEALVAYCERIAASSGGVFGLGRISAEERTLLSRIAADLKKGRS
jgi:hypothetical protein